MEITNSFTVDAPIATAWSVMTDIPTIAPCLPGATLTARAFDKVTPGLGKWLVTVASWLFAISTMISWSYYGSGTITRTGANSSPPTNSENVVVNIFYPIYACGNGRSSINNYACKPGR